MGEREALRQQILNGVEREKELQEEKQLLLKRKGELIMQSN